MARWERTRAKGKTRFAIRVTAFWLLVVIPLRIIDGYVFEHHLNLLDVIILAIVGPVAGFSDWWMMESEYKAAQIDARRKAALK